MAQAEAMAARLPPVTAVFFSPLTRAVQTARKIDGNITTMTGLRGLDYGQWDGLTFAEIRRRFPELYAARERDKSLMPPGSEPPEQAITGRRYKPRYCEGITLIWENERFTQSEESL